MSDRFVFEETPFYFLRHGETGESQKRILQGQTETVLNSKGCDTAAQMAARLVDVPIGSIVSSTLRRAVQTAEIIAAEIGAPLSLNAGLMERAWGQYEGRPKDERPATEDPPTVETMEAFTGRILATMRGLSNAQPLLIVAHSGVFRVLSGYAGHEVAMTSSLSFRHLVLFQPPDEPGKPWRIDEVR